MTNATHALETVPADRLALPDFAALFMRAYSDYMVPLHLDEAAVASMIRNWDLSLADSRVVLNAGTPVAFACLAIRGDRGWIGGMGVPPEHRGHRLGEVAMRAVLDAARARGLASVGLEVLSGNDIARHLYERLGFETTRMLDIWSLDPLAEPAAHARVVESCSVVEALAAPAPGRAPEAPWQRAAASIVKMQAHGAPLEAFATRTAGTIDGIVILARAGGRASVLALDAVPDATDALLVAASAGMPLRLVNVAEDDPHRSAIVARGGRVDLRQYEMCWRP
jgi:ribosomal protein S18 acetylase RimI-like enzyme